MTYAHEQERVFEALERYRTAFDSGSPLDKEMLLTEYSDVADELSACFHSMQVLENAFPDSAGWLDAQLDPEARSVGPICLGDFQIVRELGRGGMGIVYEAEQMSLGRRVALKVLPFASMVDDRYRERFKTEARAAASLKHPNIVSVHQVGCERGIHYYAMELVDGKSLAEVVAQLKSSGKSEEQDSSHQQDTATLAVLSTQRINERRAYFRSVARLAIQVCDALHYAHQEGVVHRDIKPSNLLLDQHGRLWITDFGLAHINDVNELTVSGDVLGTLRFMSPEQVEGRKLLDHRTDIYSMGITLYELLTLRPAFSATTRAQMAREIVEQEPVAVRKLDQTIPNDLETIVMKATCKQADGRYETAEELANDLRRFVEFKPILARRNSRLTDLSRWCRRNPVVASLATLVTALLVAVAVVGSLFGFRQAKLAGEMRGILYVAETRNAFQAWNDGNHVQARALLSRHRPEPGQTNLRGFGWHHLWSLLQARDLMPRLSHDTSVYSIDVHKSGQLLATGCHDGVVRIWNLGLPRKRVVSRLRCGEEPVLSVAFSFNDKFIAACSGKQIVLWDLDSSSEIGRLVGHTGEVTSIAYSPTEDIVASTARQRDETLRLWDVETRKQLAQYKHTGNPNAATFSPDGKLVAFAGEDRSVVLWDVAKERPIKTLHLTHVANTLSFSPGGRYLASGGYNYEIRIWDLETYEYRSMQAVGHTVKSLAFSSDGELLVSGGTDDAVRIWDAKEGRHITKLLGHDKEVNATQFLSDENTLATASEDGDVVLCEIDKHLRQQGALGTWLTKIAFLSNDLLATSAGLYEVTSEQGTMALHNIREQTQSSFDLGNLVPYDVAYSSRFNCLAIGGREVPTGDQAVRLFDASTGERKSNLERRLKISWTGWAWSVEFSPDGTWLAAGGGDWPGPGRIKMWNLETGEVLENRQDWLGRVLSIAFSPTSSLMAVGTNSWKGSNAAIMDARTLRPIHELSGHSNLPRGSGTSALSFSPDGTLLASGGSDDRVMIWDVKNRVKMTVLVGHTGPIMGVAFTPDGRTLATAGVDAQVKLWHVASGNELTTFNRHAGAISVRFSPDGRSLAVGHSDQTVKLYYADLDQQEWSTNLR